VTIERLSPGDRLMLVASETWPQEIGALATLDGRGLWADDGRLRITELRERIESRLHLVPRMRQLVMRPPPGRGGPLWVDVPRFDIGEHVRVVELASADDLLATVERLRRRRLDPSRPGWEMWFLTGLPERRVSMFVKIHHAMADGMAAMTVIGAFLDAVPGVPMDMPQRWQPAPPPRDSDLVADALRARLRSIGGGIRAVLDPGPTLRTLRGTMPAVRELLAGEPPPLTSLDGVVGQDRRLATMPCTLSELRRIGDSHDATVNDVLLALITGGLRALLLGRGEPVSGLWVPIYVPITLRRRWRGPTIGNRVAQMAIPLPLGVAGPRKRLARIATATAAGKAHDRSMVGKLFRSSITTLLLLKAVDRQRVNVCSANIPGPRRPLFLAGSRILDVVPILPLIGRVSLGVGAISYAGAFTIGVTADREAFPDLGVFVTGMERELSRLRAAHPGMQPDRSAGNGELETVRRYITRAISADSVHTQNS
jgi:diacylglycerol O-acyltransferase